MAAPEDEIDEEEQMDAALVMESEEARQNCKPERLFVDCTVAMAGGRCHCETKHESVEMVSAELQAGALVRGLHRGDRGWEASLRDEARERGDGLRFVAKMHVDANNYGSSRIIPLGNYMGD